MKRSPRPPRTPSNLSDTVHQRLNSYAMAASAAAVGVLVLAQQSEGKIVYTPVHEVIPRGHPGLLLLDLNHDGTADFKFENWWNNDRSLGPTGSLSAFPAQKANGVLGYGTADKIGLVYFASALRAGARIGPKASFFSAKFIDWMYRAGYAWGPWKNVKNRYVGLRFILHGKTHYGWARLNVSTGQNLKITAVLTGYAYETIPNKPIGAGQIKGTDEATSGIGQPEDAISTPSPRSATLGVLAAGAHARSLRRRQSLGATR
jgi:hypothetical protein